MEEALAVRGKTAKGQQLAMQRYVTSGFRGEHTGSERSGKDVTSGGG